jgi:integrase
MRSEASNRQVTASGATGQKRYRSQWPKSDLRYWTDVVYRPAHQEPDGTTQLSEYYVVRIGHGGRRTTFPLGTPKKAAAAAKARDIHSFITVNGMTAAIARFKKAVERPNPLTVGQYLAQAQKHLEVRPKTFAAYAAVLRRIAADIAGFESDNRKFDYQSGGREKWRHRVDAIKLELLTQKNIRDWRTEFLSRAKGDSVKLRAARNSVSSFIRAGKALFSQQVLKNIETEGIERSPFADIALKQPSLRYRSEIDFEKLLKAASTELAPKVPIPSPPATLQMPRPRQERESRRSRAPSNGELFKIFLLCATAGLRRSEVDTLEWSAFHFQENFIRITTTKFFEGKSESSHDDVYLDPEISALFRGFWSQRKSKYVIESPFPPKSGAKYEYYRCQRLFEALIDWLRQHGVTGHNPIHVLRKEYGSQLTKSHGIFTASRALRQPSVQTTERFYASQKGRVSLGLGHLFVRR